MRERIGVVRYESAAGGPRQLILPSGEIASVGRELDDADTAERFGLDAVRHADAPGWCRGACRDGPMAGAVVYAVNQVGSGVLIALPPQPDGPVIEYQVTQGSADASAVDLHLGQS